MNETSFPPLEQLIAAHTGLQMRPRERDALRVTLAGRMNALKLRQVEDYHRLLEAATPEAHREWEHLTAQLTNNETYFFRDKGQMALLRERILPELIARNRDRRVLRLWSAGCATGEEAYSLAILVEELLLQSGIASGAPWEILLLGTDIEDQVLQQARRGIYSAWSFRTMDAAQRQRWFQRRENGWQVSESTRAIVTFRRCNLVADTFPDNRLGIHEMDLILCRNVFIYFAPSAIARVLPKFAESLREGGYLMTGHAETLGQIVEPLVARQFPESMVYQRVSRESISAAPLKSAKVRLTSDTPLQKREPAAATLTAARSSEPVRGQEVALDARSPQKTAPIARLDQTLAEAESRYRVGENLETIRILQSQSEPLGDRALLLMAHAYANLGRAEEAGECCRQLSAASPFAAEPYELLASLAQEQGHYEEAKLLLKQALYLAPGSPAPYLELGELYEREGDKLRARTMRATALDLLKRMPAETAVGFSGGPSAQEWRRHLEERLTEGA